MNNNQFIFSILMMCGAALVAADAQVAILGAQAAMAPLTKMPGGVHNIPLWARGLGTTGSIVSINQILQKKDLPALDFKTSAYVGLGAWGVLEACLVLNKVQYLWKNIFGMNAEMRARFDTLQAGQNRINAAILASEGRTGALIVDSEGRVRTRIDDTHAAVLALIRVNSEELQQALNIVRTDLGADITAVRTAVRADIVSSQDVLATQVGELRNTLGQHTESVHAHLERLSEQIRAQSPNPLRATRDPLAQTQPLFRIGNSAPGSRVPSTMNLTALAQQFGPGRQNSNPQS